MEEAIRREAKLRTAIHAYYAAARHAVALARVYQSELGTTGRREREAVAQVAAYRKAIGGMRRLLLADRFGPGLSKTMPEGGSAGQPKSTRATG